MRGEDDPTDGPSCSRPYRTVVKDTESEAKKHSYYSDFNDLIKRVVSLKCMQTWRLTIQETMITIVSPDANMISPKFTIGVDNDLNFTIRVYNYMLPEDHQLYKLHHRSIKKITVSNLIQELESKTVCEGVHHKSFSGKLIQHSVPFSLDGSLDNYGENEEAAITPFSSMNYCRTLDCVVLGECQRCEPCSRYDEKETKSRAISEKRLQQPAKTKAPISATHPNRIKLTLQYVRSRCSQLEAEVEAMRVELKKSSVHVDENLTKDFIDIMGNQQNVTPFMSLFWQEQKKIFSRTEKGARFHPEIIRFCLSLSIRSPSVYEELRNTGILRLSSRRTLRSYKNFIRPKTGFCDKVLNELTKKTKDHSGAQRYVCVVFDEMKIKSNLVFDKHSGELIGFIDLGDPDLNFASLENQEELATHVLVFFIRGLCTDLSFALAHFATNSVNALQTFHLFWEAVCLLETVCALKVLGATCDGANANRSFFKMCHLLDPDNKRELTYRAKNIYAPERFVYFFSDPPHLIKTARNCLANSASGDGKRYLWNGGLHLLWEHISGLYYTDLENGGKTVPKLTAEHLRLNAYSRMTVRFAAEVLSETVAKNLELWVPGSSETARFCSYMDNVRNWNEHHLSRKPSLDLVGI